MGDLKGRPYAIRKDSREIPLSPVWERVGVRGSPPEREGWN